MATATKIQDIEQISLSLSVEQTLSAPATAATKDRQQRDLAAIRKLTLNEFGSPPTFNIHERLAPFSICLSRSFASYVRDAHVLLDRALVDIVERWFSDERANFPVRMPLERHEEDLLRWIDGPGSNLVGPFRKNYGMWRTDYLVEGELRGQNSIKICEINARIPFNGIWLIGLHGAAYKNEICKGNLSGFEISDDFEKTKRVIFGNFDQTKPLYHIHGIWPGVDSHGFLHGYAKSTRQNAKHAKLTELRLEPDVHSPGGYKLLYCSNDGSTTEEVEQCTLELFQDELVDMDQILLRKIATCCLNDFRTILLLHDKRILGVVLDELEDLKTRNVLTKEEALRLKNAIAETLLSGTDAIKDLLTRSRTDPTRKNDWIAKPVRDASCNGIKLGSDMTQEEWLTLLEAQSRRRLRPTEDAFVIQRMVKHVWFPIVRHNMESSEPENFHLIGSHHVVNSQYNMFGPWRLGEKIHVGVTGENKGIVMNTVLRPEGK